MQKIKINLDLEDGAEEHAEFVLTVKWSPDKKGGDGIGSTL